MAKTIEEILVLLVSATTEATEAAARNALRSHKHAEAIEALARRILRLEGQVRRLLRETTRN